MHKNCQHLAETISDLTVAKSDLNDKQANDGNKSEVITHEKNDLPVMNESQQSPEEEKGWMKLVAEKDRSIASLEKNWINSKKLKPIQRRLWLKRMKMFKNTKICTRVMPFRIVSLSAEQKGKISGIW